MFNFLIERERETERERERERERKRERFRFIPLIYNTHACVYISFYKTEEFHVNLLYSIRLLIIKYGTISSGCRYLMFPELKISSLNI